MYSAFLIFALVLLSGGGIFFSRRSGPVSSESTNYSVSRQRSFLKRILLVLGIGLVASSSVYSFRTPPVAFDPDKKIVIVVDASKSMLTKDLPEGVSRIDSAKGIARNIVRHFSNAPVSILAFSGETETASVSTYDADELDRSIAAIDPNRFEKWGSDIGWALKTALSRFDSDESGHIFLISDGDDEPTDFAFLAPIIGAHPNLRISAVGVGSDTKSPIPTGTDMFGRPTFKQTVSGEPILTRLEPKNLIAIARAGGGTYSDAADFDPSEYVSSSGLFREKNAVRFASAFGALCLLSAIFIPVRRIWKNHP